MSCCVSTNCTQVRKSRGWGALARTVLQTKYIGGEVRVTRSKVMQDFGYRARAPTILGGAGRPLNGWGRQRPDI